LAKLQLGKPCVFLLGHSVVTGMKELNYNDRLKQLGLQRLEGRRMRNDLIKTFKIVNRKYDVCVCILRAGIQPTLDPYAEAFIAGPLR